MSRSVVRFLACAPLLSAGLWLPASATAQSDHDLIALTTANRLVRLSTVDTCATDSPLKVTGLQPSESLLGMDVRRKS